MTTLVTKPDLLPRWRDLARLSDEELGRYDIAAVNLAVAAGLPGAGAMDPAYCLESLDQWTAYARVVTADCLTRFPAFAERYGHSEARFRASVLVNALQQGPGLRYNPAKIPFDAPFDATDYFVYGAIQGPGGTCSSMPVVYASVGRRLGYPIGIASCRGRSGLGHRFNRWDGGGERFNVDGTGDGCSIPPDDYYRTREYAMTPEDEAFHGHMLSITPRQELAEFLAVASDLWGEAREVRRCIDAIAWAVSLDPGNRQRTTCLEHRLGVWRRLLDGLTPPGFPRVAVRPPARRLYPDTLPLGYEETILALMAADNLLLDPEWGRVWERMRRGGWRGRGPNRAEVAFRPDGSSAAAVWLAA
ncbi:MAG: hypothetical protein K2X82_25440 [Gemmataceae bacterium]|nr:hypothetical protein [Gemmataceae bacterium]